ncbi:sugar transporter [Methylobacterium sp. WL18]|uniref:polysaccharide biosynthesis/export family protein n=1 Tax=Methylobacterium sp. WL18 TaxID=2603897 RepID=UPI0011CC4DD9|nr:polysaccharide biosynthesis/export family protein [Methylobacterium sp. WL18]TXN75917.1 sugar transporter [Methylobacterium sp. WL18]
MKDNDMQGMFDSMSIFKSRQSYVKIIFFSILIIGAPTSNACAQGRYTLGPGDHISIKVWDVRNGDPYQWAALNGEFIVGADDHLSLPLLGDITASALTTSELATAIGTQLKNKIGLSTTPSASAQVVKYRPFYITGSVQRPGKYEYVPSLTVIQAISIAEGMLRPRDLGRTERDVITNIGETRLLEVEHMTLLARQARLNAVVGGQVQITFPPELSQNVSSSIIQLAMQQERSLFAGQKEALEAQLTTINQAKKILASQLSSISEKSVNIARQLSLMKKDLSTVNDLAAKGMVIAQRQLSAEQNVAALESNKLDIELATLKAQQDMSQAERDIVTLTTKFKTDALSEATEVRSRLEENRQKFTTSMNLTREAEKYIEAETSSEDVRSISYVVIRASTQEQISANLMTEVGPGDVVQVVVQSKPIPSSVISVPAQRK